MGDTRVIMGELRFEGGPEPPPAWWPPMLLGAVGGRLLGMGDSRGGCRVAKLFGLSVAGWPPMGLYGGKPGMAGGGACLPSAGG